MTYHFIGLGGIGMSALARILLQNGHPVQGSDAVASPLLDALQKEGADVQVGHSAISLKNAQQVVYSSGIQEDNVELRQAKEKNIPVFHRSDLLNELMRGKKNLLVTGTHGKTTTTALLTSVLLEAQLDPSFVIGGLLRSLNTNGKSGKGEYFVAEADESDGSFLKTAAHSAIITTLADDHLNFWGDSKQLDRAFQQFIDQTHHLFWCADEPRLRALQPKGISYGFSSDANLVISHFRQTETGIVFDLGDCKQIKLNLLGRHNALNGAAVFALARSLDVAESTIRSAFAKFAGTCRRLEWKGEAHKVTVYDDYGHHPREIAATIKALRDHVRERRLIVVFQPHRYTRVRDLFEEFTTCFSDADEVFLTDIYAAGESPIDGVSSAALFTRMRSKMGAKAHFLPRSRLEEGVAAALKPLDVVLTIGAGDVTGTAEPILRHFVQRAPKLTVGVLCGGSSAEHPVSLSSAENILKGLDTSTYEIKLWGVTKEGEWVEGLPVDKKSVGAKISASILESISRCDVCIPVFHGPQGEDGMIAALLDALQIPYVGCDYRSGAICMQKGWTKSIAQQEGIATSPFMQTTATEYASDPKRVLDQIEETFPYPVWVKPVHLGSSIGVSRACCRSELVSAVELALYYDEIILIEKEIIGRQIEFSVLGNEYIRIASPAEIINHGNFVAYDKKYGDAAMEIQIPAAISEEQKDKGAEWAEKMYRACSCKGLARIDFFLDNDGNYWLNEINPFPGFTNTSAFPKAWASIGMSGGKVVDELLALAFHRSRRLALIRGKQ